MSYTTTEIIEQTKIALAYLEDGARETGVKKLAEVVARSHSYWPLVNLSTGHEAVAIGSALVEGYTRLRPTDEDGVYLADDDRLLRLDLAATAAGQRGSASMSSTESVIPTIVSAEQAADALGISTYELYWNIRRGAVARLEALAAGLDENRLLAKRELNPDYYRAQFEGVLNLIAAAKACDEAWRKDDEDE